jgi:hypothetical protein
VIPSLGILDSSFFFAIYRSRPEPTEATLFALRARMLQTQGNIDQLKGTPIGRSNLAA